MTAPSCDTAFEAVGRLVSDFAAGERHYLSPDYQEAEVRRDFIDKFFAALGWDVHHETQKNPYEQEVKVERGVAVAASQRRADYAFHVAPNFRDVRFFVEAKKPRGDIATADNCFQTIRYGWNSGTPLAVLTDFEQFLLLDCRYKPDVATALNRIVAQHHYSAYRQRETFDRLYWLFSREAVAAGALEKFAKELPRPKGKATQLGLLPGGYKGIDEAFLEELDEYRTTLARAFKKLNPELDSATLTEITQRTLDRLVFLRFLEDRMIEPHRWVERFAGLARSRQPASGALVREYPGSWDDFAAACRRLDGIYNGIVFKKHALLDDPGFRVDEEAFTSVCESLAHANSPYDFNVIPLHILGSIYERFLGKVIVATDKRVRVEAKPEVRKAGGVYYTPEYIVRYIVENTVGKLIEGKSPDQIAELRFADIACGSGSFLLGVYDALLQYHGNWYNAHPGKARKGDCVERDGRLYLSLRRKREILLNNVYGVDIDAQAVEVAQLSLYLKLLQDETTASAREHQLEFHETLLPSLAKNIVCGNSLIGRDILEGQLFPPDEERKLNPMDFEDAFPEVMKRGGFDAIVGNPPYVLLQDEFRDDRQLTYFRRRYEAASYKIDTYHLFMERALRLMRSGGRCSMITPANLLTNNHLASLRRTMLARSRVSHILVIDGGVFQGISVDNAVFVVSSGEKTTDSFPIIHVAPHDGLLVEASRIVAVPGEALRQEHVLFTGGHSSAATGLWSRIEHTCRPLGSVAFVNFGKQLRDRKRFTQDVITVDTVEAVPTGYRPCYTGRDVNRYSLNWGGLACLNSEEARKGGCWAPERQDAVGKLVTRQIGEHPSFGVDVLGYQCLNTVFMVNPREGTYTASFLLGVLNSRLMRYLWETRFYDQRRTFPKVKGTYLEKLPIPLLNPANPSDRPRHDQIVKLVDQMLDGKKQVAAAKTDRDKAYWDGKCAALDRQIDRLVYELYELTEAEIRIVEGG